MKSYLKYGMAILLIFAFSTSQAQIKFGPRVGLNMSTMTLKSSGVSIDPKTLIGFHVGVMSEIGLSENLKFQPGILYSTKGSKFSIAGFEAKMNPGFIEVPLNVAYVFGAGGINFSVQAGPYLAYGISGKVEADNESQDISFGSADTDDMKPLDIGLNLGASAYFGSLFVTAQYGLGLANVSPTTEGDTEMKHKVIGISVGYLFGGK